MCGSMWPGCLGFQHAQENSVAFCLFNQKRRVPSPLTRTHSKTLPRVNGHQDFYLTPNTTSLSHRESSPKTALTFFRSGFTKNDQARPSLLTSTCSASD